MIRSTLLIFLVLLAGITGGPAQQQQSYPTLSPFDGLAWRGEEPEIRIGNTWYALEALNGISADEILEFCRKEYQARWQKRFREDLVEVLFRMGHRPETAVDLELRDLETGARIVKEAVPMTHEKRQALWLAAKVGEDRKRSPPSQRLTSEELSADLEHLQRCLEDRFAYARLHGLEPEKVLDPVRDRLKSELSRNEFGLLLMKALARFGDAHSGLSERSMLMPPGCLPFLAKPLGSRVVAMIPGGTDLFDAKFPYVHSVDDFPIAVWLRAANLSEGRASPHLEHKQAVGLLHHVAWLRQELGRPASEHADVVLEAEDGKKSKVIRLKLGDRVARDRRARGRDCRRLEDKVGLIRVPSMEDSPEFLRWLRDSMGIMNDARGLILDVRGNAGGTRDALRVLFPYFMKPGDPPRVANIAAYRLPPTEKQDDPRGYLANRSLYPRTFEGWSDAARAAIARAAEKFTPDWKLPDGAFSDWHFMVLERPTTGAPPTFEKPVVILMDSECFSATDVFLGAFKGHRNVTLLGTPSGGGSGRARVYELPMSGFRVRLSSMASFLPDGTRYDGVGIAPDVLVEPTLADLLGRTDTQLEAALRRLQL